jgi:hypothetical protein
MKYAGMPMGMWLLFRDSFKKQLVSVLNYSEEEAEKIVFSAKEKYRDIIGKLPEFEKKDRFKMNIVNCAMFCAFLWNMDKKADLAKLTEYYERSMMTGAMKCFCRLMGRQKFTKKDIQGMKDTASLKAADRNIFSWNMDLLPYPDGSGYEARFYRCGICTLMKELGLSGLTPAMCRLDYTMSEAGGTDTFIRTYTLASGGPYCDCGYKKKS